MALDFAMPGLRIRLSKYFEHKRCSPLISNDDIIRRYWVTFAGLFLLAFSTLAYAQSSSPGSTGRSQTQTDCSNPVNALSEDCAQNQNSDLGFPVGQSPSQRLVGPAGQRLPSTAEDGTLRGKMARMLQNPPAKPAAPTEFQQFVLATTGQDLPVFGTSLFLDVPSTFSADDLAPVTSDYVVGPEDELRIRIWGQFAFSENLRVDRSGNIYLPNTGPIHVAGLQFSQLDAQLRKALSRVYRNFDLSIDLGRIRSMQIYLAGQANRPGAFTVSSLSSLVDALFAGGGAAPQGSLRHILVNRGGKTISDFDLYSLLVRGDKSNDIRLLPEDVLYIPPAGPQVAIFGSIRSKGIYELREGESLGELVEMAGRTTVLSSTSRVTLERVGADQRRQALDFSLDASGMATKLHDGDIVRIFSILPAYKQTVLLRGSVANPGRFSWRPGMRLSDIVPDRDSLMTRNYWWTRAQLGVFGEEFEPSPQVQGTSEEVEGEGGHAALGVEVKRSNEMTRPNDMTGSGGMAKPRGISKAPVPGQYANEQYANGRYANEQKGPNFEATPKMTVASSATGAINWKYAVIERTDPETLKTSLLPFDLGKLVLEHDASQNLELQPGDIVTIFSQGDLQVSIDEQTKYISIEGEIANAGVYSVHPGETLRDVVRRAGGLTQKAYLFGSEFDRESVRLLQQDRLDEYVRDVEKEVQRNIVMVANMAASSATTGVTNAAPATSADLQYLSGLKRVRASGRIVLGITPAESSIDDVPAIDLENGDSFKVPSVPATVQVIGAVYSQSAFLYKPDRTVRNYIKMAGGPNRYADTNRAYLIRADGSVINRAGTKKSAWNNSSFEEMALRPGETLVIPEKILRPGTGMKTFTEWTTSLSQIALAAATIGVLATR